MVYRGKELYHHGILGQKWGKRNGPPYPLDSEDHSMNERRAGWRKSLDKEKKYDSRKMKKALMIAAGIGATAIVAYAGYKIYQNSPQFQGYIKLGKKNMDFIKNSGTFDYLDVESSAIEIIKPESFKLNTSDVANNMINKFDDPYFSGAKEIFDPEQLRKLNDDELRSLQAYTTNLYHDINHHLRGDGEVIHDYAKDIANNLKTGMEKLRLSSDVEVSRGIDSMAAKEIFGEDVYSKLFQAKSSGDTSIKKVLSELEGVSFMDNGVMSTSRNTRGKVIESFSGKNGFILDIKAPKGAKAVLVEPFSEASYEKEIAFAPGASLMYTGEYNIINGIVHLYAQYIG